MENIRILRPIAACIAIALGGCASEATRNPMPGYVMGDEGGPTKLGGQDLRHAAGEAPDERRVDLYKGTGQLVKEPAAAKAPAGEKKGEVDLNFARVELQEVIQTIMGDLLRENFIVDPGVSGEVTLHTSRPVAKSDLIPILEDLLRTHGAIMVREMGGLYRISPLQGYKGAGMVPELAKNGSNLPQGFGVRIVPLQHIGATEMQKILAPLAPESAFLRVDTIRNLLVLAGSRQQLANMMETIDTFDVDWLKGMSVGFFELKYSNVEEVGLALEKVLGADADGPMAGLVRVLPLERLRGIMLITPRAGLLDEARKWVDRLDRQERGEGIQLFVYHVQNTKAAQLANMLGQLYGGEAGATGQATQPKAAGVAPGLQSNKAGTSPSGTSAYGAGKTTKAGGLSSGGLTGGSSMGGSLSQSRSPFSPSGAAGAAGAAGAPGASGVSAPAAAPVAITTEITEGREPVRIVANEENNSLVVLATPDEFRKVESALQRLDVQPLQVLVEASIVEVKLTDKLKYGLQWYFNHSVGGYEAGVYGNSRPVFKDGVLNPNVAAGDLNSASTFSYTLTDAAGVVRTLLSAEARDNNLRVISSPSVLVLDNHTAEIRVGDQIPVKSGDFYGTTNTNVITSAYQYKDTGVILSVTPRVNAGGFITMEIAQEVTDAVTGSDTPIFTQRSIKSTVAVQSGESIVLGGLIKGRNLKDSSGVPGLKDIPGLGVLFSANERTEERTELLVLLTPRAVRNQHEIHAASNEVRQKMKNIANAYRLSREPSAPGGLDPLKLSPLPDARRGGEKADAPAEPRVP